MEPIHMKIKRIDHLVIVTADLSQCISFYERLGFQFVPHGDCYALFMNQFKINVHLQGKERKPNAQIANPGTLDICFEVEGELEAWRIILDTYSYVTSNIAIKDGVRGSMKSFYVRDPDQNLIELCSYQ